jgi:hypothetical protein
MLLYELPFMCHGHQGQERSGVYSVEPGDAKGLETSTQSLREYMGSKVPLQDCCRTSACRHRRSVYSSVRALWAGAEGKTRAEHKSPLGGERRRLWGGFGVAGKAALDEEDAVKAADLCMLMPGYNALVGILSIFGTPSRRVGHGLGVDSRRMQNNGRYVGPVGACMLPELLPRALESTGALEA